MSEAIKGNILTPAGWVHGAISFGDRVSGITGGAADPSANGDDYIIPGFIDLHVHGGGGRDTMEGGDAVARDRAHARAHGTTAAGHDDDRAAGRHRRAALGAIGAACRTHRARRARACWACTSKARTSIPASSARSPTSRAGHAWPKCSSCTRSRRSA